MLLGVSLQPRKANCRKLNFLIVFLVTLLTSFTKSLNDFLHHATYPSSSTNPMVLVLDEILQLFLKTPKKAS